MKGDVALVTIREQDKKKKKPVTKKKRVNRKRQHREKRDTVRAVSLDKSPVAQ